jgi:hypothetical protein
MGKQIIYTPENLPKSGKAKMIWDVLVRADLDPQDLHYNGGKRGVSGGGTWACELGNPEKHNLYTMDYWGNFCGILGKTLVYIQSLTAPYDFLYVGFTTRKCPFRSPKGCTYYSRTNRDPLSENDCPQTCDSGSDDFLKQRNEEYEKTKGAT